jgi:hypothetical protein
MGMPRNWKGRNAMVKIEKIDIWTVEIEDKPGATTRPFNALAEAGADLQFVLARRQPDKPGKGILFVSPIKGAKQEAAARREGFAQRADVVGVRVEGVNLRALIANVNGKQFVAVIAFHHQADADKGYKIISQL